MKKTNLDYTGFYGIYKKLPFINFIATMVLSLVWGIIDWCEWITEIGELEFGGLIIWLLIGAVVGLINTFFTCIYTSPTIVRTDATVAILDTIKNGAYSSSKGNSVVEDELPNL